MRPWAVGNHVLHHFSSLSSGGSAIRNKNTAFSQSQTSQPTGLERRNMLNASSASSCAFHRRIFSLRLSACRVMTHAKARDNSADTSTTLTRIVTPNSATMPTTDTRNKNAALKNSTNAFLCKFLKLTFSSVKNSLPSIYQNLRTLSTVPEVKIFYKHIC